MRTLKSLAQESLDIQHATNILALAHGFARAIADLRTITGTNANNHPIVALWVDKFASLTNTQTLGHERVLNAYTEVYGIIENAKP